MGDRSPVVESPGWFGPQERPLFGWFVAPRSGRVRGAVVLCQPVAEEGNMAYRTFRTLSLRLAEEGFLALRFDYDGTGDSAGSFEDPGRADAWVASVREAVAEARRWGAPNVSLVGMRLGATLGHAAAAGGGLGLHRLVLWDPCATGRGFLRELQLLQSEWLEGRTRAPKGWVETPSYRFTPDAAAGLRGLAIDGSAPVAGLAARTSVLARADRTAHAAVVRALPADEVDWLEAVGQHGLLNVPTLHASVPTESLAAVVSLLSSSVEGEETAALTPRLRDTARWVEDGREIEESICFFGPERLLFGIRTSTPGADPALPRVVCFNVAAERHLGEGRTWVRLTRALAADGFTSVRADQGGVGDSGTRAGHPDDVVYDEGWIHDVPAVADDLAEGSRHEVIGVGLCSSGTSVLQGASSGALSGVVAVNVVFDADRNANLPPAWTLFPRKPAWLRRFAVRHKRVSELVWSVWGVLDPRVHALWSVRRMVGRGVDVTLLEGPEDAGAVGQNPLWWATWGRRLAGSPRFRVEIIPDADHSLRVSSGQDAVVQAARERLRARLDRDASDRSRA